MVDIYTIALFGEAERGRFHKAHYCENLPQLVETLGNPPPESRGLHYAVQALLYEHHLIFFRVEEEGFSYQDYLMGLKFLENQDQEIDIAAVCLPGVGDTEIINAVTPFCYENHSIIITTEPDLYDFLTENRPFS